MFVLQNWKYKINTHTHTQSVFREIIGEVERDSPKRISRFEREPSQPSRNENYNNWNFKTLRKAKQQVNLK